MKKVGFPASIASYGSVTLLLLFIIAPSICLATPINVYFAPASKIQLPLAIHENSCPAHAPCQFGDSTPDWYRYYHGISLSVTFRAGTYNPTSQINLGCSGNFSVTFEPSTVLNLNRNMYFGNLTHRMETFTISNSTVSIQGTAFTIYAYAVSEVKVVKTTISQAATPSYSFAFDVLSESKVKIEDVIWTSNSAANSAFSIQSSGNISQVAVRRSSFQNAQYSVFVMQALTIGRLEFDQVSTSSIYKPSLIVHPSGPSGLTTAERLTIQDCRISDMNPDMKVNFRLYPETAYIQGNVFRNAPLWFRSQSSRARRFRFSYNEVSTGAIRISRFREADLKANIFEGSQALLIEQVSAFESSYDQYRFVGLVETTAIKDVSFDGIHSLDSNFSIKKAVTVSVAYSSIERQYGSPYFMIDASSNITLFESAWTCLSDSDQHENMLFLSTSTPRVPVSLLGSAIIAGLEFTTPASTFENFGELRILDALKGAENQSLVNSGKLTFHSHPESCEPVLISQVRILPTADPNDYSLLSAVVWKAGPNCGAIEVGPFAALMPSQHALEVLIVSGDVNNPVNGSDPVPILHVSPTADFEYFSNFTAVYPSAYLPYNPTYAFTGLLDASFNESLYEYTLTNYSCPKNCSGHGVCVGVNTCACSTNYTGYSCACHDLPAGVSCSVDEENQWQSSSDLEIARLVRFEFPNDTGANLNGSVFNGGELYLKDARYDIKGAFENRGQVQIVSTISQVRNSTSRRDRSRRGGGCMFVPTSRSFAQDLVLSADSTITVNLDLASASSSVCPSGRSWQKPSFLSNGNYSHYGSETELNAGDMLDWLDSKRQSDDQPRSRSRFSGRSRGKRARSKANKAKSLIESDTSRFEARSTLVVNILTPPNQTLSVVLFASRNASAASIPLLIQINAPDTCTTIDYSPTLVSLIASPCPHVSTSPSNSPHLKGNSKGQNRPKWYYFVVPIVAVFLIAVIVGLVIFNVPKFRQSVFPYSG